MKVKQIRDPGFFKKPYLKEICQRPFEQLLVGKKKLIGAEIGVYRGTHAKEMLILLDIEKLILVDFWEDYDKYNEIKRMKSKLNQAWEDSYKILNEYKDKVIWIKGKSEDIAKIIADNSLDFVYIDANHTYEYVKQDIELWTPKVKNGGYVGGHDYVNHKLGVKKAVDEYCKINNIQCAVKEGNAYPGNMENADWAFIKNGGKINNWEFKITIPLI